MGLFSRGVSLSIALNFFFSVFPLKNVAFVIKIKRILPFGEVKYLVPKAVYLVPKPGVFCVPYLFFTHSFNQQILLMHLLCICTGLNHE